SANTGICTIARMIIDINMRSCDLCICLSRGILFLFYFSKNKSSLYSILCFRQSITRQQLSIAPYYFYILHTFLIFTNWFEMISIQQNYFYCSYYQAHVKRELCWFVTAALRSYEHIAFDRTLDTATSLFEFFVAPSTEKYFLEIM